MMASNKDNSQEVRQALQSVSKACHVREDVARMMKPYANWEEYLKPAPLSIAILSELVLISLRQDDFSINTNPPKDGFKYIKYPESFRACLAQVSNQGWEAFSEAHVNMDKIRLLSSSVPGLVKVIVQILFQDLTVMDVMLPNQLKNLHKVAVECTTFASAVKDKFTALIFLVQELLEASLNAERAYGQLLEEAKIELERAKIRQEAAEETKKIATEHHEKMKEQADKIFTQYKEAMKAIPSGWDAVGMDFVQNLANGFLTLGTAFCNQYAGRVGMPQQPQGTEQKDKSYDFSQIAICTMAPALLINATQLQNLINGPSSLKMDQIYDQETGKVKTNGIKCMLESIKGKINSQEKCEAQVNANSICSRGIAICENLEKIAKSKEEPEMSNIVNEISNLYKEAMVFDSYSKACLNSPVFHGTPPNLDRSLQELAQQGGGRGSSVVESALLKVQQSQEALKATQEAYQKTFENLKKENDKLAEIYADMKKCEVKKIDFESAQKMLIQGLRALGHVKTQWEKMVRFFNMISNLIDTCLNQNIKQLISTAEGVPKIAGYSPKSFIADMIYDQAFTASTVAYLVNMIAETYMEVSEKHLMDRVSSLGKLITMQVTDSDFMSERDKMIRGCENAQRAIYEIVIAHKKDFDNDIEARAASIEVTLKAALPPVDEKLKARIEEAAKQGYKAAMKEITPAEEGQYI